MDKRNSEVSPEDIKIISKNKIEIGKLTDKKITISINYIPRGYKKY